ncbi:hypothetical protein E1263_01385 [Kribbella antibiotica]|uniref:Uncharacterized protein n=1 Tax=Kribbella antibiotica TaxID=190195 RepID=A0A4R4ZWP7_9ACTN|nr:hypothetical protein [Kribbella antibiotica]TDD62990.1 hypothetical protein E1263_01385 [Kribbella antibiotica]
MANEPNPYETHKSGENAEFQTQRSISKALDGVASPSQKSAKSAAELAADEAAQAAESKRIQDRLQGL